MMANHTHQRDADSQAVPQTAVTPEPPNATFDLLDGLRGDVEKQTAVLQRTTDGRFARAGHSLLQLQHQYGNQHVQRVVAQAEPPIVQTKLVLGPVGDKYEQEADQVAQQVVVGNVQGVQVQRQVTGEGGTAVTPEIETAINQSKRGGQPLPESTREQMGQALGSDLSNVRVHTDDHAHTLNQSLQARAFTTGQDIFFRHGEYNPGSSGGQTLLAHELTHVTQQNNTKLQPEAGGEGQNRPDATSMPLIQRKILSSDGKTPYEGTSEELHRELFKVDDNYVPDQKEVEILGKMLTDDESHTFQWGMGIDGKKLFTAQNQQIIQEYKPPSSGKKKVLQKPKKEPKEAPTTKEFGPYIVEETSYSGFVVLYRKSDAKHYKGFKDYINGIMEEVAKQSIGKQLMELVASSDKKHPFGSIPQKSEKNLLDKERQINQYLTKQNIRVIIQQPTPPSGLEDNKRKEKQAKRVIETQSQYPYGTLKPDEPLATPLPKVMFFFPPVDEFDFVGPKEKGVKVSRTHVEGHEDFPKEQEVDVILYHEFVHSLLTPIPWHKRFDKYKITTKAALENIPYANDPAKRGNAVEEMMVAGLWYGRGFQWSENVYREQKEYEPRKTYKAVGLTESDKGSEIKLGSYQGSVEDQIAQVLINAGIPEKHAEYIAKGGDKPIDYEEI